jgi:hypothetical protein
MGAHSLQAVGVLLFLLAFTLISSGLVAGGSGLPVVLSVAAMAGSAAVLYKIKPWEHKEG